MKTAEQTFQLFDREAKGYLDSHQTKCAVLYMHGSVPATLPLKDICRRHDKRLTLDQFKEICDRLPSLSDTEQAAEVFKAMDLTNQGFLTRADFDAVCERYAKFLSVSARRDVFAELDSNADGRVTLRDLTRCLSFSL